MQLAEHRCIMPGCLYARQVFLSPTIYPSSMAVFLPAFLIGAPIGYFTFSKVFNGVDYETAKLCQGPPPQSLQGISLQ